MLRGLLLHSGKWLRDAERVWSWTLLRSGGRGTHAVSRWYVRVDNNAEHGGVHGDVHSRQLLHRGFNGARRMPWWHVRLHDGAYDGRVLRAM